MREGRGSHLHVCERHYIQKISVNLWDVPYLGSVWNCGGSSKQTELCAKEEAHHGCYIEEVPKPVWKLSPVIVLATVCKSDQESQGLVGCLWWELCMKGKQNTQGLTSIELTVYLDNWLKESENKWRGGKQHVLSGLKYCLRKAPVPPTTVATRPPCANNNCCK